jgi:hypothetical protein
LQDCMINLLCRQTAFIQTISTPWRRRIRDSRIADLADQTTRHRAADVHTSRPLSAIHHENTPCRTPSPRRIRKSGAHLHTMYPIPRPMIHDHTLQHLGSGRTFFAAVCAAYRAKLHTRRADTMGGEWWMDGYEARLLL